MAKADKKAARAAKKEAKGDKKGKSGLIVLIVIIVISAAAVTMTVLNAFGLRDNVLVPMLRNIPVIGGLMPESSDYALQANFELIIEGLEGRIAELEAENASLSGNLENIHDIARVLEQENAFNREFADMHDERTAAHNEFVRAVAEENPDALMEFFAASNPALLEEILWDLIALQMRAEEWENYIGVWGAMNPVLVAQAIETMALTHMPLIVSVLPDLPVQTRAAILNALEADTRAAVLRQMYP